MNEAVILASASPTRRKLLVDAGVEVRVEPAVVDEEALKRILNVDGQAAGDCALALAEAKARRVASGNKRALVVGADQILVCGKTWFNKPTDLADARAQLLALRGRTHELVSAVCVVHEAARIWHTVVSAKLTMRQFSDGFLDSYLISEEAAILGSVGGYCLEGRGIQLFSEIQGDYFSILGLPLLELVGFLRSWGALGS
jgi:septum formation protein